MAEAEIEAKKQKLADLKKARLERQATLAENKSGRSVGYRLHIHRTRVLMGYTNMNTASLYQTPGLGDRERGPTSRAQLDDLVSSLLSSSPAGVSSARDGRVGVAGLDRSTSGRTSRLSESTATTSDRDREREKNGQGANLSATPSEAGITSSLITSGTGSAGSVSGEVVDPAARNT
jgi:hypothetical protein